MPSPLVIAIVQLDFRMSVSLCGGLVHSRVVERGCFVLVCVGVVLALCGFVPMCGVVLCMR